MRSRICSDFGFVARGPGSLDSIMVDRDIAGHLNRQWRIHEHGREFENRGFGCDSYFEASGVNWLAINCQPLGPFSHTSMLRYCPLASLPLYCPLIWTRLLSTGG